MNQYPIQSWLKGVIVKRQDGKYVYQSNGKDSQPYPSIKELVEDNGTQAKTVQRKQKKSTGRSNRKSDTKSSVQPDELVTENSAEDSSEDS